MKNVLMLSLAVSILLFSSSVWSASTKEEVVALREQVEAMQKDLAEIKEMLKEGARAPAAPSGQPAFKEQTVSIGDSPVMGDENAPVTLIEYSDYQCPFCARHYREVMPVLKEQYIDTGKLRFIMRENPIESIHRHAASAAMAGLCAQDQGKYWEMHDLMFSNQQTLDPESLKGFAKELGLDAAQFDDCLDSKKNFGRVNEDIASGTALGVRGTPGFFLGLTDPADPNKADMKVFIRGAKPASEFQRAIDDLLATAE
jgi:protein-disulfide isomerase